MNRCGEVGVAVLLQAFSRRLVIFIGAAVLLA